MENDPKQLSLFDFDKNLIDNPGEEKKHPLNNETTLEGFKNRVKDYIEYKIEHKDHKFYFYIFKNDLLLESPFLNNNIDYIPNKEDFIKLYNGYRIDKTELDELRAKYNKTYIYLVDNDSSQLTEENKDDILANKEYQGYRYLIAYYFNNPYEKKEDKIAYILNLNKFEYPKKYVYDIINKKEILRDGKLTAIDKNFLNFGFNEFESWDYSYKPLLERYYNKQGLEAIKKYYISIPHDIEPSYSRNHIDHAIEYKEYNFFMDILLNVIIQENALINKNIVDYKTILKDRIERINNNIIYIDNEIKQRQDLFNSILDSNKLDSGAFNKWLLSNNPDMELKEILSRDSKRYNYFKKTQRNELLYPDEIKDYNYIDSLKLSDKDSLEYAYYINLEARDLDYSNAINKLSLDKNKESLKKIDQDGTIEAYYQDQAKIYFNSKYHLRDNSELIEREELDNHNEATITNNIANRLYLDPNIFQVVKNENEIKEAQDLINRINELESKIKEMESLRNKTLDYEEREKIEIELTALKEEYSSLENAKSIKKYITINNKIIKVKTSSPDTRIIETKPNIYLKNNDYELKLPKMFDTRNAYLKENDKEIETYSLDSFTPKMTNYYMAFLGYLIKRGTGAHNKEDIISLKFLRDYLDLDKKRYKNQIIMFLSFLKATTIENANFKYRTYETKKNGKVEYKKEIETYKIMNIIYNYSIDKDNLYITYGNLFELTRDKSSKIYTHEDFIASPEQLLISSYANILKNQTNKNDFDSEGNYKNYKEIALIKFIGAVPSYYNNLIASNNHDTKNNMLTIINDLDALNKNALERLNYIYNPSELRNANNIEDYKRYKIGLENRENKIPVKINKKESNIKESIEDKRIKRQNKKAPQKKKKV